MYILLPMDSDNVQEAKLTKLDPRTTWTLMKRAEKKLEQLEVLQ